MPKININGIVREMTQEEIKEMEALAAQIPTDEPTAEQRIEELEEAIIELASLLGGNL